MRMKNFLLSSLAIGALLTSCSDGTDKKCKVPELKSMKCEFVADGDTAVFFGKNLRNANFYFYGNQKAVVDSVNSNDSIAFVIVPSGASAGKVCVENQSGISYSKFMFRDYRNTIVDFDSKLATWGGFAPFDEHGEKITQTYDGEIVTKIPATLPDKCDGSYGFLYGNYENAWSMTQTMFLQYVANPAEGGRGNFSIAGEFRGYPIEELALKFEVYIPKECPYNKLRTEIFFGPFNSPDKHGREKSPIYFWEPYKTNGDFYTEGWQTITVPLTEFWHTTTSDEAKFESQINLKDATNFTFVQFGNASKENPVPIFICVDNFRVVPIAE